MLTACAILCPPLFYLVHGTYILFLLIFQESFYIFQNNSKFFVKCIRFHDIPVDIEFIFKPCILAFSVSSRISRSEERRVGKEYSNMSMLVLYKLYIG